MQTDPNDVERLTRFVAVCDECGSQLIDTEGKIGTWSATLLGVRAERHYAESGHDEITLNVEVAEPIKEIDMTVNVGELE